MKRLLISFTIFVTLVIPQFAMGDDVADLKATQAKVVQAWNTLDSQTLASVVYPGSVSFDYDAAFPGVTPDNITPEQLAAMLKASLSNVEFVSLNPYNLQYKVVGNTGIIWGHSSMLIKPKGEPPVRQISRYSSTWVKSNGKWLMLSTHLSAIPSGK